MGLLYPSRMSPNISTDYREVLRRTLKERCARNPRYSLRSFARDLGLSPSRLSDVLKGRYGISRKAALEIAPKIGMNSQETERFCDQVESLHARDRKKREAALGRLAKRSLQYRELSLEAQKVMSDWYHHAILQLCLTKKFQNDPEWIARQLGLPSTMVSDAIERMQRLNLLHVNENGVVQVVEGNTTIRNGVVSDFARNIQSQILEKARVAVLGARKLEIDQSGVMLAFDSKKLEEARADIQMFRRSFDAKYSHSTERDRVYCLAVQFFPLDIQ